MLKASCQSEDPFRFVVAAAAVASVGRIDPLNCCCCSVAMANPEAVDEQNKDAIVRSKVVTIDDASIILSAAST